MGATLKKINVIFLEKNLRCSFLFHLIQTMTDIVTTESAAVGNDTYVPTFKKETRRKESENEDLEFSNAKAFLSSKTTRDGASSLYDHLTSVVSKILETKAPNAFDSFESISAQVKKLKFKVDDHSALFLKNVPEPSQSLQLSQAQASIFTVFPFLALMTSHFIKV